MMIVRSLLTSATQRLAAVSDTPYLDASILLGHVLGLSRTRLAAEGNSTLTSEQIEQFAAVLHRREQGEPVAYLVGQREFYGLRFAVDERVLIPRPDTEILVEQALSWIAAQNRPLVIADVGTGSGCIAVTLAVHAPQVQVYALDLSPDALAVARRNIDEHGVGARVMPVASDGLAALNQPVDLVISNPPYTLYTEIEPNVRRYEPRLALDGGSDGLHAYRWLLPAAAAALRRDVPTAVLLEIGAWQVVDVTSLARTTFPAAAITVHPDLAGRDRVVEVENYELCIMNDQGTS